MEADKIQELIRRYNEGLLNPAETDLIVEMIGEGAIGLNQLTDISALEERIAGMKDAQPSANLDLGFYAMLAKEKKKHQKFTFSFQLPSLSVLLPRLAFSVVLIAAGFLGGYWLKRPVPVNDQVQALSKEVGNLKEMMMLSLLEKESASERLRAVSLTSEMDQASKKVTCALLGTLNNDSNVNVRLAALDALRAYVRDNAVRAELIRSISRQESPMVQVALAELMRDIQEKKSVTEFNKILKGDKMPDEVKSRIREKIQILI